MLFMILIMLTLIYYFSLNINNLSRKKNLVNSDHESRKIIRLAKRYRKYNCQVYTQFLAKFIQFQKKGGSPPPLTNPHFQKLLNRDCDCREIPFQIQQLSNIFHSYVHSLPPSKLRKFDYHLEQVHRLLSSNLTAIPQAPIETPPSETPPAPYDHQFNPNYDFYSTK